MLFLKRLILFIIIFCSTPFVYNHRVFAQSCSDVNIECGILEYRACWKYSYLDCDDPGCPNPSPDIVKCAYSGCNPSAQIINPISCNYSGGSCTPSRTGVCESMGMCPTVLWGCTPSGGGGGGG